MRTLVTVLLGAAILLAGCGLSFGGPGGDAPVAQDPGGGAVGDAPAADGVLTIAPGDAAGPAVAVRTALNGDVDPVRVAGSLVIGADGRVLLCSALAESFPPQCGGDRLEVRGLDLETVAGLQAANGVRWADSVELTGRVD